MATALLIIDFQNDFTPGGALPVADGDAIAGPVQRLADALDVVAATRDWHPADHSSFEPYGGPWPVHCVRDTHGAEFHPAMAEIEIDAVISKGVDRDDPGYSGFAGTELAGLLRNRDAEDVFVVGLATEYCVRVSAIDAVREELEVTLVEDGTRGLEVHKGDVARAIEEMRAAGARVAQSADVLAAVGR